MIGVQIVSGRGAKNRAAIDKRGLLSVSVEPGSPAPVGSSSRYRFLSQLASSVGDGTGVTNMNVNGSSTAQAFTVNSVADYDIRIQKILIYIEDSSVTHSGFGALAALSNGVDISVFEDGTETFLVQSAKKFADLIQQTLAERPFGADASSFELASVTGTADAQVLPMDIGSLVPGGIRIGRGTKDKFQVEVNDDLTGLDFFTVRVLGYRHYP